VLKGASLRYYRMLRVPSIISKRQIYIYLLFILLLLLADTYPYILLHKLLHTNLLLIPVLHATSIFVIVASVKFIARYIKFRQATNATLFLIAPGLPVEFISSFFGVWGSIYTALPILSPFLFSGLTGSKKRGIAYSIMLSIALQLLFIVTDTSIAIAIARFVILFLLFIPSIHTISQLDDLSDLDVFMLASAWTKLMLTGNGDELESIFSSIAIDKEVKVRVLRFERAGNDIVVVVPAIHFGPYKTLGSTYFPYILESELSKNNITAFIFHGAGSHELNVASSVESERLAKEITRALLNTGRSSNTYESLYEPFRVFSNLREAFCLHTDTKAFIIISSPVTGGDDLPQELQKRAEEIAALYGFADVAVIDAHNVEGDRELRVDVFEELIKSALSKHSNQCSILRIGYGEERVHGIVRGLCTNKVKVLAIECNSKRYGIIYLYGNNAEHGVREALRHLALQNGFVDAEVVTLDDHTCAGTAFDSPYYAVELSEALLNATTIALHKAVEDLKDARVTTFTYTFTAKLMGEKVFDLLELATRSGSAILRTLKVATLLLYILWIFILALILH
jgi:putative membrane protein